MCSSSIYEALLCVRQNCRCFGYSGGKDRESLGAYELEERHKIEACQIMSSASGNCRVACTSLTLWPRGLTDKGYNIKHQSLRAIKNSQMLGRKPSPKAKKQMGWGVHLSSDSPWEHCPIWGPQTESGCSTGHCLGLPEKLKIKRENPAKEGAITVFSYQFSNPWRLINCAWAGWGVKKPTKKTEERQRFQMLPGAEGTVWNSRFTKLEGLDHCLSFSFETPEASHLMIKPEANSRTLRLKANQNNPTLVKPKTKPLQDQDDPPVI